MRQNELQVNSRSNCLGLAISKVLQLKCLQEINKCHLSDTEMFSDFILVCLRYRVEELQQYFLSFSPKT